MAKNPKRVLITDMIPVITEVTDQLFNAMNTPANRLNKDDIFNDVLALARKYSADNVDEGGSEAFSSGNGNGNNRNDPPPRRREQSNLLTASADMEYNPAMDGLLCAFKEAENGQKIATKLFLAVKDTPGYKELCTLLDNINSVTYKKFQEESKLLELAFGPDAASDELDAFLSEADTNESNEDIVDQILNSSTKKLYDLSASSDDEEDDSEDDDSDEEDDSEDESDEEESEDDSDEEDDSEDDEEDDSEDGGKNCKASVKPTVQKKVTPTVGKTATIEVSKRKSLTKPEFKTPGTTEKKTEKKVEEKTNMEVLANKLSLSGNAKRVADARRLTS